MNIGMGCAAELQMSLAKLSICFFTILSYASWKLAAAQWSILCEINFSVNLSSILKQIVLQDVHLLHCELCYSTPATLWGHQYRVRTKDTILDN